MFALIVQTVLLIAIAFILGCMLGCLLHSWFGAAEPVEAKPVAKAPAPQPKPAPPAPVAAPVPPAPVRPPEKAPVVAEKPPAPKPVAAAALPDIAPPTSAPDNLKLIRGIGPQNERRLNAINVTTFAQIAAWTKREQREIGEALAFPGRIEREEWVKQAKVLAKGGSSEFSKRVESGSVSTSVPAAQSGLAPSKPSGLLDEARGGKPDNLTLIDGVGNAIERKMFKLGIYHFDQIAKMSDAELVWLSEAVGFPGRAQRENWKGEAEILGAGGTTEHAKRVERGVIKTSRKS